jgi:L-fuculose-phosphate aldolase
MISSVALPVKTEREHREEIVRIGKLVWEREYVAATDGNLSVRLGDGRVLATPTCMSKALMAPDDLVLVDADGRNCGGTRNASSEIAMHLLIYRMRSDVHAVVHAHPPTATGFAAAGLALDEPLLSEAVIGLGCVPLARYATPGTPDLCTSLEPLVPEYDAILMANHGVVTYGTDLLTAYMKMETVEHFAKVSLVTRTLGRQKLLTDDEVAKLLDARNRYENGAGNNGGAGTRTSRRPVRQRVSDKA